MRGYGVNCPLRSPGCPLMSEPSPLSLGLDLQTRTFFCLALRIPSLSHLVNVGIMTQVMVRSPHAWQCLYLWPGSHFSASPLWKEHSDHESLRAMPLRHREGKELLEPCVSLCGHLFIPQTYLSTWEPHWGERDIPYVWILALPGSVTLGKWVNLSAWVFASVKRG